MVLSHIQNNLRPGFGRLRNYDEHVLRFTHYFWSQTAIVDRLRRTSSILRFVLRRGWAGFSRYMFRQNGISYRSK